MLNIQQMEMCTKQKTITLHPEEKTNYCDEFKDNPSSVDSECMYDISCVPPDL